MNVDGLLLDGWAAVEAGRDQDAIGYFDRALASLSNATEAPERRQLAWTLAAKRDALTRLDRGQEAELCNDELIERCSGDIDEGVNARAAEALLRALSLRIDHSSRKDVKALVSDLDGRFGGCTEPSIRAQVLQARNRCAVRMNQRRRPDLAWDIAKSSLRHFGADTAAEIQDQLAWTRDLDDAFARSYREFLRSMGRLAATIMTLSIVLIAIRRGRARPIAWRSPRPLWARLLRRSTVAGTSRIAYTCRRAHRQITAPAMASAWSGSRAQINSSGSPTAPMGLKTGYSRGLGKASTVVLLHRASAPRRYQRVKPPPAELADGQIQGGGQEALHASALRSTRTCDAGMRPCFRWTSREVRDDVGAHPRRPGPCTAPPRRAAVALSAPRERPSDQQAEASNTPCEAR